MDQAMTLKHLFQVKLRVKGSKHKMPINLSNEEEASKGKIEETINIAGFTVSVTGLGLGRNGRKRK